MDEIAGSTVSANGNQANLISNDSGKLINQAGAHGELSGAAGKQPISTKKQSAGTGKQAAKDSKPSGKSKVKSNSLNIAAADSGQAAFAEQADLPGEQSASNDKQLVKQSKQSNKPSRQYEKTSKRKGSVAKQLNPAEQATQALGLEWQSVGFEPPIQTSVQAELASRHRDELVEQLDLFKKQSDSVSHEDSNDGFGTLLEQAKLAIEQSESSSSPIGTLNADSDSEADLQDLRPTRELEQPDLETRCQNGHSLAQGELFCMICGLSERNENVQKRIRESKLSVDESILLKALVLTSRQHLEAEWERRRTLLPESDHEALSPLLERKHLTDEDLIILLSASSDNFISSEQVIENAAKLSSKVFAKRTKTTNAQANNIQLDREAAIALLSGSKSQIYAEIDSRIGGFARCGIEVIDTWADSYRLEKQMPLERCLVLLAVPKELWLQLPRHQYINEILKFGERRIMATINQGPLVLLRVTRSSSTLDILELGSAQQSSQTILEQLLERSASIIELSPEVFESTPSLERRIRGLVQKTTTFRRDTGKHSLFLGFPFVVLRTRTNDDTKTKLRVAPVLLFPVRIDAEIGSKGKVSLASSHDRDEIRLNPALSGILELGPKDEANWKELLDEIMSQPSVSPADIVAAFSRFCPSTDDSLVNIPGKETVAELGKPFLSYSAALFHCDFTGKAVADDLRNICDESIAGTALELALRVVPAGDPESDAEDLQAAPAFDLADHAVIAADPSQEIAVQQSRNSKGLHIEGPPGTGKSQTIVNIIADCVARNETVLVICQKQAALTVVEKRLKAEGLGRRLFFITDVSKDRQSVIRALREQLDERAAGQGAPVTQLRKDRASLMSRLQGLDAEINKHHSALHDINSRIGLSYRSILAELIQIEAANPGLKLPRLRAIVKDFDNAGVSSLSEECAAIANLWLESKFEISPLQDLKVFSPDEADAQLIRSEFTRFARAEEHRFATLAEFPKSADVDDITVYVNWLKENEDYIRGIQKDVRVNLSRWVSNFFPDGSSKPSVGHQAINSLMQVSDALSKLNKDDHSPALFAALASLTLTQLKKKIAMAQSATTVAGVLNQINPMHALNRYRLRKYLKSLDLRTNNKTMLAFLRAAVLEQELRAHREVLEAVNKVLRLDPSDTVLDLERLQHSVSILLSQLTPVAELSSKLRSCPLPEEAKVFAGRAASNAFDEFSAILKGVIKRHAAKTESLNKLNRLSEWFDDEWVQAQKRVISAGRGNIEAVRYMQRFLQTIVPFQEFRLRAKSLSHEALEIFALLREHEADLLVSKDSNQPSLEFDLLKRIASVIRREACLAWKSQLETEEPARTIPREEIDYKVKSLAEGDEVLRKLNRKILAEPNPEAVIATGKKWEDLTRLSGARARRLRELLSNGAELGLMNLRPIWLMNPETASRLLPLSAGLFDAVIFDEASQLLVEYALPTLFRAKRAIVSGDEKQMPPPNFFAARLQNDEAIDLDDDFDESLPQEELERMEEAWNRREIKDCPDLLNLASAVLPSRSLQIHYRSEFRELIAFSNAAFYSGTLSIPSRRPQGEVKKARPIEVISVNSIYEKQVNLGEAIKIAEILQELWSTPAAERPTIGVVSFNLKQADLIEETLQELALKDARFKEAFEEEARRTVDGEDVGFFVKNLENVQGDERDIIIFSTTFGKDSAGVFRRNFGKLGQQGGERRLNVAITRAKSKVILVTSLPTEKIADFLGRNGSPTVPRDYFQAYMDYASKVSSGAFDSADRALRRLSASDDPRLRDEAQVDDPFIIDVSAYIASLGYQAITQQRDNSDAFNIDIAIENPRTGLFAIGIECDAPCHHILTGAKHREIWRQSVLSKSIPKIHRISSREWYQKKERERELLKEAIMQALRPEWSNTYTQDFAPGDLI